MVLPAGEGRHLVQCCGLQRVSQAQDSHTVRPLLMLVTWGQAHESARYTGVSATGNAKPEAQLLLADYNACPLCIIGIAPQQSSLVDG